MKPNLLRLTAVMLAAAALPVFAAPKKVLVVTVTTGFRHASIPTAEKVLTQLAAESGGKFAVDFVRQPAGEPKRPAAPKGKKADDKAGAEKFAADMKTYEAALPAWNAKVAEVLKALSPANLKNYDAVAFVSTTGDLPLPDPQGFVDWVAAGHGFVGVHAATDTFHRFPPYIAMIGGEFKTHGPQVPVECINEDPAHAATKMLPAKWMVYDEIYQMKSFERAKVHGLLSLETLMRNAEEIAKKKGEPGDYPVAWAKLHGKGRVFYTSLGHRDDVWDPAAPEGGKRQNGAELSKLYQQHVRGGVFWALGLEK
ncbi:MAG: ThuA domain-containing protein [Verrucomicrobia bacterium]|nr:ThuA domain-containing protein [Verrucomicrobiota bacterium]